MTVLGARDMLICEWRGRHLWIGSVWFGQVVHPGGDRPYRGKPYCGRLMIEEGGGERAWFGTEREARKFLLAKAYARMRTAVRMGDDVTQHDPAPDNRGGFQISYVPSRYSAPPQRPQE